MAKKKTSEWPRHRVQALWALLTNSYLAGFLQGKIYRGKLKNLCVPGLNCYSCPGAIGSCPIGALQAVIGSWNFKFAYYVAGFLVFVGALVGRFVCGWLCPFGLIQDLLHKIPFPKKIGAFRGDKLLRKLKYVVLAVFVILLPLFLVDILGQGAPYFCKLLCPAGTLEGGIPLVLLNDSMRGAVGWLYAWKNLLLAVTIFLSILIYRPFCKYICPLGAIYSLFNPISVFRYRVDEHKCTHCGACARACKMQVDPVKTPNHPECIRCGQCKKVCPTGAITFHPKKTAEGTMLNSKGFDLWADGYDKSVGLSDEDGTYPFAGYRDLLNEIYNRVLAGPGKDVLDIGFGTGTLTAKLYEQGCHVSGQDFSERMLELAREKMPEAKLYRGDFSLGLAEELKAGRYDAIIATYSLYHLTDEQKVPFLRSLLPLLKKGGSLYIGDVAFETRAALEECRESAGSGWDADEFYFVYGEMREAFPELEFQKISPCAGLLTLRG